MKKEKIISPFVIDSRVKRFRIFEIATFTFEIIAYSAILTGQFSYLTSFTSSSLDYYGIAGMVVGLMFLAAGLVLSVIGLVKDDFYLNKWGVLVLFLAVLISTSISIVQDFVMKKSFVYDLSIIVVSLFITGCIVKEMTSLYAEKVVKILWVVSLIFLIVASFLQGMTTTFLLASIAVSELSIQDGITSFLYIFCSLLVPCITFFMYPMAIKADYSIQDDRARKEALEGKIIDK